MSLKLSMGKACLYGIVASTPLLLLSTPSYAVKFNMGSVEGSFDSNISVGASWRLAEVKDESVTPGNREGGTAKSGTNDDGNLNFENDKTFSKIIKGVHDLELRYSNFGGFTRFKYWYDKELKDESRLHGHGPTRYAAGQPLDDEKFSDLSKFSGFEVLDAFLYGELMLGPVPADIRVGKQVISWGESTFISNSINTVNPIDVNAFRRPGAEIKEGLLPVNMVYGSFGLTEDLSLEAFYQLDWENTQIDPCGTYFSTSDIAAEGCEILTLSPAAPDSVILNVATLLRTNDAEPEDSGQFGVTLRYYSQKLNDTEFGFYYINYHSRIPFFGVTLENLPIPNYIIEFPENIKLFGISFNTNLGAWAWSGELSHRQDSPVQINGAEVVGGLFSFLDPTRPANTFTSRVQLGEKASGFDRFDVSQFQTTLLRTVNQIFGASRLVVIGEFGYTHVHDDLEEHPYGRSTNYGAGAPGDDGFITQNSWGYRLRASLDYSDVFAGINLTPSLSWAHDVSGFSPSGGAFNEGNKAVSLGVNGNYQNFYKGSISYTNFFGGNFNTISDRDFIAASFGVAF